MNDLKERIHENGMDYVLCGDYYIPEITIPKCDRPIGHYGRLRKAYLKEYRPVLYSGDLATGRAPMRRSASLQQKEAPNGSLPVCIRSSCHP